MIGVVNSAGTIVACTELRYIGDHVDCSPEFFLSGTESAEIRGYTFRMLHGFDPVEEYAVFAASTGDTASAVCAVTVVAINNSKAVYDEKNDKISFIRQVLLDNILPGDIYIKSREARFSAEGRRVCILIRMEEKCDSLVVDMLQHMFQNRQQDFAVSMSEYEVVLVKEADADGKDIMKIARQIDNVLRTEFEIGYMIGIGSVVGQTKHLSRSYKEACTAIAIGRIFNEDARIVSYENLGIGRLIYQLPTTLCDLFLSEVFKKGSIDILDDETLFTIDSFFENNLNVSETSRKLFVHRNTLVYRIEKIKKLTGLDLREFDDAIVLKVALMVKKFLKSKE